MIPGFGRKAARSTHDGGNMPGEFSVEMPNAASRPALGHSTLKGWYDQGDMSSLWKALEMAFGGKP